MSENDLSPKQRIFVAEYLVDKNATRAAIAAGYSEKTAPEQGSRLLTNVKIRSAVESAISEQVKRLEIKSDDILRELSRIGYSDIAGAFNQDGTLKNIHEIPKTLRRAIASIEVLKIPGGVGYTQKVKLWPKLPALELLGKHKKLFTEKIELSGTNELADRLQAARERREKARGGKRG